MASVAHRSVASRRRLLPPRWPLHALFAGFPLWWVLGLGGFIWLILAVPMAAWLLRQKTVLAPRGFTIWVAFLLWMFGSGTRSTAPIDTSCSCTAPASTSRPRSSCSTSSTCRGRPYPPASDLDHDVLLDVRRGGRAHGRPLPHPQLLESRPRCSCPRTLVSDELRLRPRASGDRSDPRLPRATTQARPKAPFVYSPTGARPSRCSSRSSSSDGCSPRARSWKNLTACMFVVSHRAGRHLVEPRLWLSLGAGSCMPRSGSRSAGQASVASDPHPDPHACSPSSTSPP